MENNRVLVTGGSGYFGEILCKNLIKRGYECSILDLNEPDYIALGKHVNFFKCDIRDEKKVFEATKNIDHVFHNVAQVPLSKNKKLFHEVNYLGTENILKASLKYKVKNFVYTSSSAIFGIPASNPVTELTEPSPGESYGKAKLHGEEMVLKYQKMGLKCSIIRPRTILGNGRLGIFQILFEWIYQNKNIPVFDGGDNLYQFIHSDDLSEAIINCINSKNSGIYNIGASDFCSMKETLNHLIVNSGSTSKIKSVNSKLIIPLMKMTSLLRLSPLGTYHSMMYGKSMYFDINKAQQELKWSPKYSNKEMILESYNYYLENRLAILEIKNKASFHKSRVNQGIISLINYFI